MLREMDTDIGEIDLLITESTYAKTEQIPRKTSEDQLIEFANYYQEQIPQPLFPYKKKVKLRFMLSVLSRSSGRLWRI